MESLTMEGVTCSACGFVTGKVIKINVRGRTHWFCCQKCTKWFERRGERMNVRLLKETMRVMER